MESFNKKGRITIESDDAGHNQRNDWDELNFIYMRAERAAIKIQQNFRERNAKRIKLEEQQRQSSKDDATIGTIVSDSTEEGDDAKDKKKEARRLDDDFWSRCAGVFTHTCFTCIIVPLLTVFTFCSKVLSKGGDDIDPVGVADVAQGNIGTGPTP